MYVASSTDVILALASSLETSQVLWKQAEVHKGPKWLSSESGGDQCSGGQILHPRCFRHDRRKLGCVERLGLQS